MTLTITLPHPPQSLRPNFRGHWARKSTAASALRKLAKWRAMEALAGAVLNWKKATVLITWESTTARHPDPDNIIASLKSAFDGLQDAGVVLNDSGLWPVRPVILTRRPWPQVTLRIEEELD